VPGGPLVWCAVAGFRADRVVGVVIAVGFAVGGDRGCLGLPGPVGGRVSGCRAEGGDCPGGTGLGGVLAQALGAVVHHGGDLGQVVDPQHRLLVSPRLRADFSNGDQFYAKAGQVIDLPERRALLALA